MSKRNFLAEFIQEPVYVIREENFSPSDDAIVPKQVEIQETAPRVTEEPEVVLATPPKPLPTKGENLKHCIILLNTEAEIIGASEEEFLYKILGAVKRQANDVLIANIKDANQESIDALLAEHNHRHLIAFGLEKLPIEANSDLYEISSISGKQYLLTDHLSDISQNQDKKKALWKALQSMFL